MTVANDAIRFLGKPEKFEVEWSIPVSRPGWHANILVSFHRWSYTFGPLKPRLDISVHVFAYASLEDKPDSGTWNYSSVLGDAPARRFTRKWILTTLAERIETARLAIMAITEADLKRGWDDGDLSPEEKVRYYRGTQAYFESTLDAAALKP